MQKRAASHGYLVSVLKCVLAGALLVAGAACGRDDAPLNLLVVTIDTIRADHLGCYGYFRETTPAIDSLAAESLLFERCIVPIATTLPAHLSLMTGLYPIEHGVLGNIGQGGEAFLPASGAQSYAEIARRAGYLTAAFVSAAPLDSATGIARGFDLFDDPEEQERDAAATTLRALQWIDRSLEEPFLLWVHYFDPHAAYRPPPPFDEKFLPDERLRSFLEERGVGATEEPARGVTLSCDKTISRYDGEIGFVDDQLSVLLFHLRARGLWDRTAILLAGDHGESLGQHQKWAHGETWDEELHAPLLFRVPGLPPGRIKTIVSLADAIPLLLGQCDRLPRWDDPEALSGVDRLAAREPGGVFSQQSPRRSKERQFESYSLTGDRWKFIRQSTGVEMLYDLLNDPHEFWDRSAEHPEIVAAMREELVGRLQEQRGNALALRRNQREEEAAIDSSRLEDLRALGYVD